MRVGSRLVAAAGGVAVLATFGAIPAWATEELPLVASIDVSRDGDTTLSDVRWELPADARSGDTVSLALSERAGVVAGADWIAANGVRIGTARLDDTGRIVVELSDAADDAANRRGQVLVRSTSVAGEPLDVASSTTADAILRPGERPGPVFDAPDRTRGNKYGAWTDETETRARWVLEAPRGPWDTLDVVDRVGPGQRVDCAEGIGVRASSTVAADTGYLVDPVPVAADRVSVDCAEDGVSVRVAPVGDEIVEISLVTIADVPSTELANAASFEASRREAGIPSVRSTLEPVTVPGIPPTATPEPTPEPTPPVVEPPTSEVPEPGPGVPARLAETGLSGGTMPLVALALGLLGAGVAMTRGRRRRMRGSA